MEFARIAALLDPFLGPPNHRRLTADDLHNISTYIDLLLRWNARINLTAIRNPEEIVTRHFGESFFLARHLFPAPSSVERKLLSATADASMEDQNGVVTAQHDRSSVHSADDAILDDHSELEAQSSKLVHVIDIGSGAGFPALPVKIWAPHIQLTLIESNHKKAAFLREVVRSLTLTNVDVIAERAENVLTHLPSGANTNSLAGAGLPGSPASGSAPSAMSASSATPLTPADIVTFRAVEKFDKILPLAIRFLAPRGYLAVLVSSAQLLQFDAILGTKWHKYSVPQSYSSLLLVSSSQPAEVPRR